MGARSGAAKAIIPGFVAPSAKESKAKTSLTPAAFVPADPIRALFLQGDALTLTSRCRRFSSLLDLISGGYRNFPQKGMAACVVAASDADHDANFYLKALITIKRSVHHGKTSDHRPGRVYWL